MRHAFLLRIGCFACLAALCLGLLTACGSKSLSLSKIYGDDARPERPAALNTVTEVIRTEGRVRDLHGNLVLFLTRNEDSTLLKETVYNLTNGKKLYEADEFHDSIRVRLLDGDLYSVRRQQDDETSVTTLYNAAGKETFRAEGIAIFDRDLLYANSSVYRIEKGKVKNAGIPVAVGGVTLKKHDYPGRPSDGYMMEMTGERFLTVYDLGMNPVALYQFPSDAVKESSICRMLNNGDVLIQYQLEMGSTDNIRIAEGEYDFEQDGKLMRLCTLILSAQTGETREITFNGILVGCRSRRDYGNNVADLSDKVDNVVTYTPLGSDGRISDQNVVAIMDNDGTVHPVEKLSGVPSLGLPYPLGKAFWIVQLQGGGDDSFQLYNQSGELLKSFLWQWSNFQPLVGWNHFSDGFCIYDESGDMVIDGGRLRVEACAGLYAILKDPDTKEHFLYTYASDKKVPLSLEEGESVWQACDSLILTGSDDKGNGGDLPVRLFNYRGEQLGSYPDCTSAAILTSEKNNSWLTIETEVDGVVTTTVYRLSK